MARWSHTLVHGAIGGLIAGTVVIFWFAVYDLLSGAPLTTPTRLAGVFMGNVTAGPSIELLIGYTLIHFAVFATLGGAAALVLRGLGFEPALRYGAAFGIGVLTSVHYVTLLTVDAALLTVLPAPHVLGANVVGGMLMMAYLHSVERTSSPMEIKSVLSLPVVRHGLVTGVIGAAVVAFWFFVIDIMVGRPFFTPAALGSALFLGVSDPGSVSIGLGVVTIYTIVHVLAFAAVGTLLVWVADRIEHEPGLWLMVVMAAIVMEAGFLGIGGMLAGWALGAIGWWSIVIGNLVSLAAMAGWIWRSRPALRQQLVERPVATMV